MSKFLTAVAMLPALAFSASGAGAGDLCSRLEARLNQMPETIGSGTASQMKAEAIQRLNMMERAVRHDMRRIDCPTDSVIAWGAENAEACERLGNELATVEQRRQEFDDLQPVLSQHIDDGTGLLPAILKEMRRAGCEQQGVEAEVEVITQRSEAMQTEPAVYSGDDAIIDDQSAYEGEQGDTSGAEELSAILGEDSSEDYGTPEDYGMIEVRPGDQFNGQSITKVELPKLENSGILATPGADTPAPAEKQALAPSVPLRDYNPHDKNVRRVGPAFLADDDGIDLKHSAEAAAN